MKILFKCIVFYFLIIHAGYAQVVLKVHHESNFNMHFSDRSVVGDPLLGYTPHLSIYPIYVTSFVKNPLWSPTWYNFSTNVGVEFNNRWLLEFGYTVKHMVFTNSSISMIDNHMFSPVPPPSNIPPFNNNAGSGSSLKHFYGFGNHKVGLNATYQFNNVLKSEKFKIQPSVSLGAAFFGFRKPENTYFHFETMGYDTLITGEPVEYRQFTTIFGKGKSYYGALLRFGLGLKFSNGKRELFRIHARYEQGLKMVMMQTLQINVDNTYIQNMNVSGSRGTTLQFGVQWPIFSYNFTKKKFYRD